jgi:MFS transporter, DHA2 family, multidrug resistance protein
VMGAGLAVGSIGFVLLSQLDGHDGVALVVTAFAILSLGLAPVFTLTTDLIVGTAPPERAGTASGMSETSSELGGALGIATLGSVVTAVYRTRLADAAPHAPEAARHTLGGAAATASDLPEPLAEGLLVVARAAFTDGLQLAAVISAVLLAVLAILAVTLLRPAQRATTPGASTEAAS